LYVLFARKSRSWTTLMGIEKLVNNYPLDRYSTFSASKWGPMGL
jgi:hypothetical protein